MDARGFVISLLEVGGSRYEEASPFEVWGGSAI
jgi:hypothetical protein